MVEIKERWDFRFNESILGIEIGDVNNNYKKEIIGFTTSGKLLIISLEGKKITDFDISENSSIWQTKICDIDSDDKNELLVGGLDGLLRTFKCNSSYELQVFWTHQFGASISHFLHADVNADNDKEIIAYSIDKSLRCLNSKEGTLLWGQLFEDGIGDAIIWKDSRNSLMVEIIACGNDGTVRSFKGTNGELLWFKRFQDKVRCVSSLKSETRDFIVCGGDDKILHVFDKDFQDELESLRFEDFIWKCASIFIEEKPHLIVSTYSFEYFNDSLKIEDSDFSSKILCLNSQLNQIWEINNINVECFLQAEILSKSFLIIGTTKGTILILEANSGKIVAAIKKNSCVNDLKYEPNLNILISCHDNGSIFAYFIGES